MPRKKSPTVTSGFEKKVVESIKEELKKHKLLDNLGEALVPTHQITEVKKGKRTKKEKKYFLQLGVWVVM